jgi:hypothetical protein
MELPFAKGKYCFYYCNKVALKNEEKEHRIQDRNIGGLKVG